MSLPELEKGLNDYSPDTEKLSAADTSLVLPDFDDPNIDKHQAVLAVLGTQLLLFVRPSLTFFQRTIPPTLKSGLPSLIQMIPIFLATPFVLGFLASPSASLFQYSIAFNHRLYIF